ncbi:hypothetical protein [Enterobacter kobei]|uniref:hypothetical protein n=1 Tax=Enterobacter kobei TaxID=208224 RepID=UPI00202183F5|nr:hypothetical protein [Enterobacter kobei]MCL8167146.1 hypothetical protein [Enterobacter kobei]MCM7795642.1 hypothetical protein [Enterobacter kobei]
MKVIISVLVLVVVSVLAGCATGNDVYPQLVNGEKCSTRTECDNLHWKTDYQHDIGSSDNGGESDSE